MQTVVLNYPAERPVRADNAYLLSCGRCELCRRVSHLKSAHRNIVYSRTLRGEAGRPYAYLNLRRSRIFVGEVYVYRSIFIVNRSDPLVFCVLGVEQILRRCAERMHKPRLSDSHRLEHRHIHRFVCGFSVNIYVTEVNVILVRSLQPVACQLLCEGVEITEEAVLYYLFIYSTAYVIKIRDDLRALDDRALALCRLVDYACISLSRKDRIYPLAIRATVNFYRVAGARHACRMSYRKERALGTSARAVRS